MVKVDIQYQLHELLKWPTKFGYFIFYIYFYFYVFLIVVYIKNNGKDTDLKPDISIHITAAIW
jgi:hypothetical protein